MKKLLDSDWLRAVQFKCNTVQKSVHDWLKDNRNFSKKIISRKMMTKILCWNFEKSFLKWEKMVSRKTFRHFLHANFSMFILLISNHTKPHPGLEWCIFHILTSEDIDDFTDIKFVSYAVLKSVGILSKYLQVFLESLWQSSVIFGNLRQSSEQYLMLLPLKHKIHIFLPLCNILYILQVHVNYVP